MSDIPTTLASRERRDVSAILWLSVGGVLMLVLLFLLPLHRQSARLRERIRRVDDSIREFRRVPGGTTVESRLKRAVRQNLELEREWERLRVRVDTFKGRSPLTEGLSADEDGRIDFKVSLFGARARLLETAGDRVKFPPDLGIPETIGADEPTETRLWQLAAIVKLLEQAIDLGVPVVNQIEALPPVEHPLLEQENALCREFPVRLRFSCSFDRVNALVDRLLEEGSFFAVRRLRIERVGRGDATPLSVMIVCGGQLFQLRQEGDVVIPAVRPVHRKANHESRSE